MYIIASATSKAFVVYRDLSNNSLTGQIPITLFSVTSFKYVKVASCFSGVELNVFRYN